MSNTHYHILGAALIAYILLHVFKDWKKPLILLTIIGIGKECYDWEHHRYFDLVDMLANFVGFLIGYLIKKI